MNSQLQPGLLFDHSEFECDDFLNNVFWALVVTETNQKAAQFLAMVQNLPKDPFSGPEWAEVRLNEAPGMILGNCAQIPSDHSNKSSRSKE